MTTFNEHFRNNATVRFYNTRTKNEILPWLHGANDPDIVELPADNPFFQTLPPNHELTYDEAGIPSGTREIEYNPGPIDLALDDLLTQGITIHSLTVALWNLQEGYPAEYERISEIMRNTASSRGVDYEVMVSRLNPDSPMVNQPS